MLLIGGEGFLKFFINGYDYLIDNSVNIFKDIKVVLFCREINLLIKVFSLINVFIDLLNKMYKVDDFDIIFFFFLIVINWIKIVCYVYMFIWLLIYICIKIKVYIMN